MPHVNQFSEESAAYVRTSCFCGALMLLRKPCEDGVATVCPHCLRISIREAGCMIDAEGQDFVLSAVRALLAMKARLRAERN